MENTFFLWTRNISPRGLEEKAPVGNRPRLPEGSHGVPARHGGHRLRRPGPGPGGDERLRPRPLHRPPRAGRPESPHLLPGRLQGPPLPRRRPFLEEMARRAHAETQKHFGNTVYLFTPSTSPTTARTTASTAASTATTTSNAKSSPWSKWSMRWPSSPRAAWRKF